MRLYTIYYILYTTVEGVVRGDESARHQPELGGRGAQADPGKPDRGSLCEVQWRSYRMVTFRRYLVVWYDVMFCGVILRYILSIISNAIF